MSELSELEQTKLYLLEVIDECVFVERQREISETRHAAQLEKEKKANSQLLAALVSVLQYNVVLEQEVLLPSMRSLQKYKSVFLQLLESKKSFVAAGTSALEASARPAMHAFLSSNYFGPALASAPDGGVEPQIDQMVEGAAGIVLRLAEKEKRLAMALDRIEVLFRSLSVEQDGALRVELHDMKTRVDELEDYISKKSLHKVECAPIVSSVLDSALLEEEHKHQHDARVKAFEMTVAALNAELATCQYRLQKDSQESARVIHELRKTLEDERGRQVQLQKENDAVLHRLASEMEQLIAENARLKAQLAAPLS